jgi:exodeoxyribonuclease V beta subunit
MTYDDLLTRLDGALNLDGGDLIVEQLRERYRVVLVDEFQDTDPTQWRIVRRASATGPRRSSSSATPSRRSTRSAAPTSTPTSTPSAPPGSTRRSTSTGAATSRSSTPTTPSSARPARPSGIVYRRVRAADANRTARLSGAPEPAALRIRLVDRRHVGTYSGMARAQPARDAIAEDLAADVVGLLDAGARIEGRPVEPGHLAVLVRRNVDAELVRDALADVDVPGVLAGAGSVFETPAGARLARSARGARAAVVHLPGARRCADRLRRLARRARGAAGDDEWENVHATLHRWAGILRDRGVAALLQRVTLTHEIPGRVLAFDDGERTLTDLRHVGELLHAAAMGQRLGTSALTGWLRRRIKDTGRDLAEEDRSRRLESDADAVQILTVHRSKGLEFPIVYLPFLWHPSPVSGTGEPLTFHDAEDRDIRKVDVALEGTEYQRHRRQSIAEDRGEDLRLMYVALTRARHQAVVWWAGTKDSRHSPLGRLVFEIADDGTVPVTGSRTPSDKEAAERFAGLGLSVEWAERGREVSWSPDAGEVEDLDAAVFDRPLDDDWRRTSYSDLTIRMHEPHVGSEPEEDVVDDEPADEAAPGGAPGEDDALRAVPSLLSAMPGGTRVGTLVHDVLEAVDFAAADLDAELRAQVARAGAWRAVDAGDPELLVAGLRAVLQTPLGPLVHGLRLCDLPRADRLDELTFELPLAGGDRPRGEVTPGAIADVLRRHLEASDPLAAYAQRLGDPALRQAVRGYLTGSVDLLLRTTAGGVPHFAIVDYKTNRLGGPDEELTAWHHRPAALAAEMQRMHYVLQALLYTVAVHRFLRWRLAGYDPALNLAGVLYLFVRGMVGADTPTVDGVPCGVFSWRPPDALVLELSDLFDRGVAA